LIILLLRVAVRVAWGSHTARLEVVLVVLELLLAHQVAVQAQKPN
jgi:hypothetical protein